MSAVSFLNSVAVTASVGRSERPKLLKMEF